MGLGRLGVWASMDGMTAAAAADFAKRLEGWGYGALWVPESRGRNVLVISSWLLANTKTLTVATGIANIYARDPQATASGQLALAEQSGGRFLIGLGVSHVPLVEGLRGHTYGKPVETMRDYVEAMRRASYAAPRPAETPKTVIAALGPGMLALAGSHTDGAHPYLVSPAHTKEARHILGPDKLGQVIGQITWSGDIKRDVEQFRAAGAETLLLGDVRAEGDRLVFEGRLFDIASGAPILAKRYRGSFTVTRRIGHTFADEVIRYLVGKPGISLSSIAFTSDRTGFKEIWAMDYDGQNQRRITGHRSTSMSPAWSPNGDALAYTSFFNGPPGIYLADIATNRKQPIVTSGSMNTTPTFSPDGRRVVFARSVEGNVEIFTSDRSGGGLRRLTHSNAIDTNPAWSPRGGEIAFTSGRAGNPHLYLMDSEGTSQRRLTFDGDYNDGAAWSPEGDLIAYTSRRGGRFQIAVTNVVTLATRVLTSGPGENESPTFSPDGRKIAYVSRRGGTKQIYIMDIDGSNVRQVTREGNNDMPDWSRIPSEP